MFASLCVCVGVRARARVCVCTGVKGKGGTKSEHVVRNEERGR